MGYTHYWHGYKSPVNESQWNDFCDSIKKLIDNSPVNLVSYNGEHGTKPEVIKCTVDSNESIIAFNGLGDNSYESFVLELKSSNFKFCKTNAKPYDLVAVAVLTLAHNTLGLRVSSDGDNADWLEGVNYLNNCLGANFAMPEFYND